MPKRGEIWLAKDISASAHNFKITLTHLAIAGTVCVFVGGAIPPDYHACIKTHIR